MQKPPKPRPDFPLFAHSRGKWAKKIDGKTRYFGTWDDPEGALREYELLLTGAQPVTISTTSLSLADGFNSFLTVKAQQVAKGDLSNASHRDYRRTLTKFANFVGAQRSIHSIGPADFLAYKTHFEKANNLVTTGNEVTRIKSAFKWLKDFKAIENVDFGPDFRKPSERSVRKYRRERGKMLFDPRQIHAILDESGLRMRAMILLGINCAFQNSDCETLTLAIVNEGIETGILEHARRKTEIERACPLWPETIEAIDAWKERRPRCESECLFVRADGSPLSSDNHDIAKQFRAVREFALIREGGFSWLRKTFATYASESMDQVAVDFVMGHVDSSMPGLYRQLIRSNRLQNVTNVVREWLFT